MKARSINGASPDEISAALQASMADGFHPTLAIVFASIKVDRSLLCEILHEAGMDILGATSSGEFVNGHQSEGAAAILLLDLPREYYRIFFEVVGERDLVRVAQDMGKAGLHAFRKPAFILCSSGTSADGEIFAGDLLMHSMEKAVGPGIPIYGGMAGDDGTFTGSYAFTYGKETDNGVAALVLDADKVSLQGMAISGWKPIGIARKVTRSEGNWLYEIDGQPALEMYLKYLGKDAVAGENKYRLFEEIGVHYPFQAEGAGDPVMRTPMQVDPENGGIKLDFGVPEGSVIRFSTPPDFDIVENVLDNARELKNNRGSEAEALLIFSCAGRLSALGPMTTIENDGLSEIWNAPIAGFYTYGEYGTVTSGKQEFHSTTCCWVAIKEK